ncbi:uncharacterized protein [Solanum lycopersicum]|uniref:Uncharacterized protein LOC107009092 isoform X2 n=1 Tax=Solanum pennellii TaxID=28526 RepID=A0ABM1FZL0_SOLPN|nr:uncharacterized protein LOC107009092 isoform X2 [Solanum pennellii]XP_025885366.1 uncharacterized protein LOC101247179 isoform X5 [Solanum lycopersicum]
MKRKRQSKITDLNFDVLKHVMYHVAVSPDGAGNLARTLSVCRLFKELADDSDILKAAAFDQVNLSGIHESFWRPAGMLCRCLPTGNPTAFNTIRKILLVRSTALEIANTRARKKAFAAAIDDCSSTCDAVDAQIETIEQFLEMLKAVLKVMRSQIAQ